MFELDKKSFGAFVAQLRREKGWTQKELAQRLFVSDKAVSKWETGASLPDTTLLVPLSELQGVSVTELLRCERMSADSELDGEQIESVVKTAIGYSGSKPERAL
ncbi:MAG TPA: helix-turn-helix transcriptional regulator, partial [Candidatus Scatomorpha merdavium]|nr:helix-turn-helix transcriptional regulator [Candidatus Scatomorpha merdavium]